MPFHRSTPGFFPETGQSNNARWLGVGMGRGGSDGGLVLSTDGGGTIIDMTDDGLLVGTLVGFEVVRTLAAL